MNNRPFNFGAGPAMLPESVLKDAQAELLDWQGLGLSVMEIGHRTPEFSKLMEETEQQLRELLDVPNNYHVLFLSTAARTQFAMIPMNLLAPGQEAGYLITGTWSALAYEEAVKIKQAYCVASSEKQNFRSVPTQDGWQIKPNTGYFFYTPNETIHGVRVALPPLVGNIPLVADMTSCILSEPLDISQFGLIFAGAQKNIANAGLTIVIVRDDLLKTIADQHLPTMLDYRTYAQTHSMYATPPTFNCYMANKMFSWIKTQGGVNALYEINQLKAFTLYDFIDNSSFYSSPVAKNDRSLMNVCFTIKDSNLESEFLNQAKKQGLLALKGHKQVGGLRASLYNSMPMAGVDALLGYMAAFAKDHA
jgi:phosphoserine aminotransferase